MSVIDIAESRKDRPAYLRFYREAVENKAASAEAGRAVMVDRDFVSVTPPYGKDNVAYAIDEWIPRLKDMVKRGKIPAQWQDLYLRQYEAWKNGQELPVNGTPIKGWGVISPATQENIIHCNIRTVEDLAAVNEDGMRRLGMGAMDLRNKAKAWLAQLNDKGPLTQQMSAVQNENDILKGSVASLQRQIDEMQKLLATRGATVTAEPAGDTIAVADILDDEPAPARGRRAKGEI